MIEDTDAIIDVPQGFYAPLFCWDRNKCSPKVTLDQDCFRGISKEGNGFKTVLGTEKFLSGGRYYFQIFINKGGLIKIGVCRPNPTNFQQAFCDSADGWAIYDGQTRHDSNSIGPKYGRKLTAGDIVGVAVNMIEGTIEYYLNGQYWGIAFQGNQLKKGELVAAVSSIYKNDVFTLRSNIKQD